jgi:hypothetical protein
MNMTIKELKEKLPDVKVNVDGKTYTGILTGRINKFATVTVHHPVWGKHNFEFSWQAVTRAINNDTELVS